jgi:ribosomal protein S18 acetylase RimI-like enzyme
VDKPPGLQLGLFEGPGLANPAAAAELADVFTELHRYYAGDAAPSTETVLHSLRAAVLVPGSGVRVAVARLDGAIAAVATFALLYPAPQARGQMFIKDLFVRAAARGRGVGEALMAFLARQAVADDCVRLDWTAEAGNPGAINFYERLGAQEVREKRYFRFDGEALQKLAAKAAADEASIRPGA